MFVEITSRPIRPEEIINLVKNPESGCIASYIGLIRNTSYGKPVVTVEYVDIDGQSESRLESLALETKNKFPINDLAMCHRVGKQNVGDIVLVFAFACYHRQEAFTACSYAIDLFKETLPTKKIETYEDGKFRSDW